MARSDSRPRLLALNQYYSPAAEADGQLLADLCQALLDEYDVTVVTGRTRAARQPGRRMHRGVEVIRVPSFAFPRRRLSLRAVNYVSYAALAMPAAMARARPDVVLCMTNPPFLGDAAYAVARRFGAPLVVVSQDLFPEVATVLGHLDSGPTARALGRATRFYLERADRVVALGDTMRRRLEAKGVPPERIRVIPNWVDTGAIVPFPPDNEWSRAHGLDGRFVVMHSGNVGHAQDLESLVRASTLLRDLDDLAVVVVGGGAGHPDLVRLVTALGANKVRLLPHQPRSLLSKSLSAASVHVVGLARGLAGYVVPSRAYGVLAAGRPLIAAVDSDSETAALVRKARCGFVVPPGEPEALAAAIREAHASRPELDAMGRRARAHAVAEADRSIAVARYRSLLAEIRQAA